MKPWTISVDLDGVLCRSTSPDKYYKAVPIQENIDKVNKLHEMGHTIVIYTARGWYQYEMTSKWLVTHGVEFDQLVMGKFYAHIYIDDLNSTLDETLEKMTFRRDNGEG